LPNLEKTVNISSALLEENSSLKNTLFENEKNLQILQTEILEKCDYMNKYNNLFEENLRMQDDYFKSNKQVNILHENERRLKELVNIQNERLKEIEESINILEIEKDDIQTKNEILEKRFDEEVKKLNNFKKLNFAKDKEINTLKKNLEEINKLLKNKTCDGVQEENITEDEIKQKSNCFNYQSTSTKCSNDAPKKLIEQFEQTETENNYVSTLGDICPELDEDSSTDINLNNLKKEEKKMRISLTPNDIVRRISKTDKDLLSTLKDVSKELNFNFNSNENQNQNDEIQKTNVTPPIIIQNENIYKEFFLLTFQSIKINTNSKNIDLFIGVEPEKLYEKIIKQNIPFHNVRKSLFKFFAI
jgi:hypothetical protein